MRFCYFDYGAVCQPRPPAGAKRRRREWVSKEKEPGGLFFRSDTPRIGRNEASAMPSAHFDHIRGEGNEKSHPRNQQKENFCLPTKVRFLNDVCPRQMMLAPPMMTASPNDAWLCHVLGQTSHHCGTKWSNIIFAKQMHHIAARRCII